MTTTRLHRTLQRIEQIPPDQQDELARLIEDILEDALTPSVERSSYAGVLAGLLPDDAEEQLLRLRRLSMDNQPDERGL